MKMLATRQDKFGNQLEIWHSDDITTAPCNSLFRQVFQEVIDKGWSITIDLTAAVRVVWAQTLDKKVVGGIAYRLTEDKQTGWLILSFTDPESRGLGINQLCHEFYEADCKELGATRLASSVHIDNVSRLKSAEKIGMKPMFYILRKKI